MRVPAAVSLVLVVLALATARDAGAGSGLLVGVHDDHITWLERPGPVLGAVRALGLDAIRVTLQWQPGRRNLSGRDHDALRRAVALEERGVRVVLAVYGRAADAPREPEMREDYCRFVRNALLRYTEIRDVVVWNEVNSTTFWQPQADAPERYAALLARCWDVLHASVADANVLTSTAPSQDPGGFVRGVAEAFRASGRTRPLFDTAGHNPYPHAPDEPPTARHDVYIGQGDYDRLVSILDEAFADTAQPAPPIWYLEDGFQSAVGSGRGELYEGEESATGTVSPAGQAAQLAAALRLAYCQPRVGAFFNFLLVDEPELWRWQSGLLWANWQRKPAFEAYRTAIDEVRRESVDCPAASRDRPDGGSQGAQRADATPGRERRSSPTGRLPARRSRRAG